MVIGDWGGERSTKHKICNREGTEREIETREEIFSGADLEWNERIGYRF